MSSERPLKLFLSYSAAGCLLRGPDRASLPPRDVDLDGVVDVNDLVAVLAAWGPCPGCPADLNDDGVVDVQDQLFVLAGWGPCP